MTTKLNHAPLDCISNLCFSPISGDDRLMASSWDAHLRVYDVVTGSLVSMQRTPLALLDCTFLRDSSQAVCGGLEKRVVCWDLASQTEMHLGQHKEAVKCAEFHPITGLVFSGSWDRSVSAWDPRSPGAPSQAVNVGSKVFCLDVGADKLVVGGADRCMHVFDLRQLGAGALEKRESSLKHQIRAVRVNPMQRGYAASSVEGRVAIEYFEAEEHRRKHYAFKCHRVKDGGGGETVHPVNALAFHPLYGTFATGGSDGGVCVWDGEAKKRLWRLNPFDTAVSALAFSADGSRLAVGISYTFDKGELMPPPPVEIAVRQIEQSEVQPKSLS